MKIFFFLLLLANIGFGLMQWLLPYEQLFAESPEIALAEELRLLNESEKGSEIETEQTADSSSKLLVSENTINQTVCYAVGPFKDKTRALEISGRYSAIEIQTRLKSSKEKEYMGIMVYLGGHKSRQQAVSTAEKLAEQGIRDYIIVNESDKSNVLSLGVYSLKKNAERLSNRLKQLNYPVETEPRYRNRTIYWLYYQGSNETEGKLLIDQRDLANGVGQVPGQCG
ncbi:MAG: hypothetical protein GY806_20985 [Gammaproteobacteria bacterium]|nr:hypothetical protein [Gammaproteobacteria bacterium]